MSYLNFSDAKIYDCFTFFNEIDLLKFRLEYLYEHVEKFIISEANITFSGNKKDYNFWSRRGEFSRWIDKIEYIKFKPSIEQLNFSKPEYYNANHDAWKIERGQRDALYGPLMDLDKNNNLIILTDVDEIWNPSLIRGLKSQEFGAARLQMSFYYFYMNCKGFGSGNKLWQSPFCVTPSLMNSAKDAGFTKIRNEGQMPIIENAGWHFSYLGGEDAIINKIESFSHQELNTEGVKNFDKIKRCVDLGLDPFDRRDHDWAFIHIESFPLDLSTLMRKYPKFLKTSLL